MTKNKAKGTNVSKEQTSRQVSSTYCPLSEIKAINKNKKQMSYPAIKMSGVFEAINEVKVQETKFL